MKNVVQEDRRTYLDVLRIFASFAVILLHVSAQKWYDAGVGTFDWNMSNIYDGLVRWAVPVFIMISGSLFLDKDKPLKDIYKKYILRIAIAFLTWSFIYALVSYLQDGTPLKLCIFAFIKGPNHLWYLLMIMGLYAIIPFVKLIIKDKPLTKYYLILALIFTFILPECISTMPLYFKTLGGIFSKVYKNINLHFVLGYTSYFILGYVLIKKELSSKNKIIVYILGIVGFISTILLTYITSKNFNIRNTVFYEYLTINVLCESIFIFVLFKEFLFKHKFKEKTKLILSKLSKYSFGAYLVHMLIVKELGYFQINGLTLNTAVYIPLFTALVFVISYAISALINQIPLLKKYIV